MFDQGEQQTARPSSAALLRREDLAAELRDYARSGDEAGVRELVSESMWPDHVERLAFVNAADEETGNTALHMASANGHVHLVQLLLEAGARAAVRNAAGNTPLHWASMTGQTRCVEALLQALQAQGESAFILNDCGRSAYDEALVAGFDEIAALLMQFAEEHPASSAANEPVGTASSPNNDEPSL